MTDRPQEPAELPNPLLTVHRQAEAELQAYGPLEIPATFGEPQAEYASIRAGCALFDAPQRGVLELTGKDRLDFLNNLVSNLTWDKQKKSGLEPGQGVYAFFLNLRGRIVADVNVLELGDRTIVETDARLVELLRITWDRYLFAEKVKIHSKLGQLHAISLHGPGAAKLLGDLSQTDLSALPPLAVLQIKLFETGVTVFRDDPCGVPGFHLLVPIEASKSIWMNLVAQKIRPIGWAAFNAARIEAGRPLIDIDFPAAVPDKPGAKLRGEEIDQDQPASAGVLPAETGQEARALCYSKCYLGQEIVARMHARHQVARKIVGFRMTDDALPIAGEHVFDDNGNQIGAITSSTISPMLSGKPIGLALVKKSHFAEGTKVRLPAEGALREATIVKLPFIG